MDKFSLIDKIVSIFIAFFIIYIFIILVFDTSFVYKCINNNLYVKIDNSLWQKTDRECIND